MRVTIIECDGCGKRAEFPDGAPIVAPDQTAARYLAARGEFADHIFHVCSPACAPAALMRIMEPKKAPPRAKPSPVPDAAPTSTNEDLGREAPAAATKL